MDEMRRLKAPAARLYMDYAGTLAMILWGRVRAGLPEQQRILRRMTHLLWWQGCNMQIAHVPSELNPADLVSSRWQGHSARDLVVQARARHGCFVRTA